MEDHKQLYFNVKHLNLHLCPATLLLKSASEGVVQELLLAEYKL